MDSLAEVAGVMDTHPDKTICIAHAKLLQRMGEAGSSQLLPNREVW